MYSNEAVTSFIKSKLCQDDPKLYELYSRGTSPRATEADRRVFRKRLGDADVSEAVQTFMTDACRPLIHGAIKALGAQMKPMGDMIVSGGEAFNVYLPKADRVVTTDIDTKFCLLFARPGGTVIPPNDKMFFSALQVTKILLWDRLGRMTQRLNAAFNKRIARLARSPVGKLLMIRPVKGPLRRRYTLKPKMKQGRGPEVREGDVLIDVEIFAMDARVKFLGKVHNIGGMLDIAIMRPRELGYDVIYTAKKTPSGLLVAGKDFLVTDLYLMQALKLRPQKAEKDRKRMYTFATKILRVNVSPKDSIRTIFLKCLPKTERVREHLRVRGRPLFDLWAQSQKALKVNIRKYPTNPSFGKLGCASDTRRPGFAATKSQYMFVETKKKWVDVTKLKLGPGEEPAGTWYVRNMAKYRGNPSASENVWKGSPSCKSRELLYGHDPVRNAGFLRQVFQKAAAI